MIKTKYFTGYLDNDIGPLLWILPKTSEYVKNFKDKNNKLMSFV